MASAMEMTMNVEMDVRKLSVRPGDKIWVECLAKLTSQQTAIIRQMVAIWAQVPIDAVLILHDQATLRIFSQEKADDVSTSNP